MISHRPVGQLREPQRADVYGLYTGFLHGCYAGEDGRVGAGVAQGLTTRSPLLQRFDGSVQAC